MSADDRFAGFVVLEDSLTGLLLTTDGSDVPADAASLPVFLVYGPDGPMANSSGTCAYRHSGTVTNATNAAPIVVTSTAHGLTTGDRVRIAGVTGNTATNGAFFVTVISNDTFSLDGTTGNGAYVSGGSWHKIGVYQYTIAVLAANGYAAGQNYNILLTGTVSSSVRGSVHTFMVC